AIFAVKTHCLRRPKRQAGRHHIAEARVRTMRTAAAATGDLSNLPSLPGSKPRGDPAGSKTRLRARLRMLLSQLIQIAARDTRLGMIDVRAEDVERALQVLLGDGGVAALQGHQAADQRVLRLTAESKYQLVLVVD